MCAEGCESSLRGSRLTYTRLQWSWSHSCYRIKRIKYNLIYLINHQLWCNDSFGAWQPSLPHCFQTCSSHTKNQASKCSSFLSWNEAGRLVVAVWVWPSSGGEVSAPPAFIFQFGNEKQSKVQLGVSQPSMETALASLSVMRAAAGEKKRRTSAQIVVPPLVSFTEVITAAGFRCIRSSKYTDQGVNILLVCFCKPNCQKAAACLTQRDKVYK